jgi:hypothetical protein
MSRLFICLVLLFLVLSPVGCSDMTTTPEEPEVDETVDFGLLFDYQTEPANAASADITPGAGGSVTATGSNGVSYSLVISPEAVDTIRTVTITPFSSLTITTMDSTVRDTSACLQGAMFEPDGLEFDSLAVLTITFPVSGVDCSLSDDYRVVLFDDDSAFYEIMGTGVNLGASSLVCTLTHFSNYGTDDMDDYEFLKFMIEGTAKHGAGFPGYSLIEKLISYAQEATLQGWEDLRVLAVQGCHPILDKLVDNALPGASADPSVSSFHLLHFYLEAAFRLTFDDIANKLKSALDGVVRGHASAGQALCAAGQHSEGKAMLWRALEWSQRGFIQTNPDYFENQIRDFIDDCGDLTITLGSSKGSVYNIATQEGSLDMCIFTLTVHVTSATGADLEGKSVAIRQEGTGANNRYGTTDASGTFSVDMTGAMILSTGSCVMTKEATFIAETQNNIEIFSATTKVTANAVPLSTSITYTHSYNVTAESSTWTTTASIMGIGEGGCYTTQLADCNGYLARSYHTSGPGQSTVDVYPDTLLMYACRARPIYEVITDGDSGLLVPYFTGVTVGDIRDIFNSTFATVCESDGPCSDIGFSIPTCRIEATGSCYSSSYVWVPNIPGYDLIFTNTGGGFDPYLWEYSHPDGYGSATMAITVGFGP